MPSAPEWLCEKFPGGDAEALGILDANFTVRRDGLIHPQVTGYKPTRREGEAIDYLFMEWDYAYGVAAPEPTEKG